MRIVVKFDGKAFVPTEPIQVAVGTEAEIVVPDRQTFEEWLTYVAKRGGLPIIDLENLDRGDLYP